MQLQYMRCMCIVSPELMIVIGAHTNVVIWPPKFPLFRTSLLGPRWVVGVSLIKSTTMTTRDGTSVRRPSGDISSVDGITAHDRNISGVVFAFLAMVWNNTTHDEI